MAERGPLTADNWLDCGTLCEHEDAYGDANRRFDRDRDSGGCRNSAFACCARKRVLEHATLIALSSFDRRTSIGFTSERAAAASGTSAVAARVAVASWIHAESRAIARFGSRVALGKCPVAAGDRSCVALAKFAGGFSRTDPEDDRIRRPMDGRAHCSRRREKDGGRPLRSVGRCAAAPR
jgi:hypothetical protein